MKTVPLILSGLVLAILLIGGVLLLAARQQQSPPSNTAPTERLNERKPAVAFSTPLVSAPAIATPTATPAIITVGTPTTVTVTVQITGATPLPGGVNLLRVGPTGTQPTILGVMHDDGLNGDTMANDKIYTIVIALNQPSAGPINLEVSAAFAGLLRRVSSPVFTLEAWPSLTSLGMTLNYPPGILVIENSSTSISLQTSTEYDPTGASEEDVAPITREGFQFNIEEYPPVAGTFDIREWLASTTPLWNPSEIQTTSVGGQTAYVIPPADPADYTTVIVPTKLSVQAITYNTSYFTDAGNAAGLAEIDAMLSSISFH